MKPSRIFSIFRIQREERWSAIVALAYVVALNALVVLKYADRFFTPADNYRKLFVDTFKISGFDPLTYVVLSDWSPRYNIYRHPLLAFFVWPFSQLNALCLSVFGVNLAVVIAAIVLTLCAFYSFIFLRRIFREVVEIGRHDATLLAFLTFTFGYTMVSISVPDHFCLSMAMLILTLYVAGVKMKRGRPFTIWQTILFFVITGGTSLNNGVKIFLANLFTNGRRFWRWRNLVFAILLPSALMWGAARLEWRIYERPGFQKREAQKRKQIADERASIRADIRKNHPEKDSAAVEKGVKQEMQRRAHAAYLKNLKKPQHAHTGKPIAKGEFSQWTDITTPRGASLVENWFGESVQLHPDYLLADTLRTRPVIVKYRWAGCYVAEALLVLLFLAGIWCGRRSRFLWLALSFMGFDLFIHIVLGFAINEVYIMAAHWLFVLPLAIGYLLQASRGKVRLGLRALIILLALWFLGFNGSLYVGYLLG